MANLEFTWGPDSHMQRNDRHGPAQVCAFLQYVGWC